MTDPDDSEDLSRWVTIMNKGHGYAGVFNYADETDKRIVELDTAREWCESIKAEFGLTAQDLRHNTNDPPDCFVTIEGECYGLELVQLIEGNHKARASRQETPYGGQLFADMQWSLERFEAKLNEILQNKGARYEKARKVIDVLLIHTAEPWLSFNRAKEWLAEINITRHANIESAFLLFEYEPGIGLDYWPILHLYGDNLGVVRNR